MTVDEFLESQERLGYKKEVTAVVFCKMGTEAYCKWLDQQCINNFGSGSFYDKIGQM